MDDDEDISVPDVASTQFGVQIGKRPLIIHGPAKCRGSHCPFHNPSDHPLNRARINVRLDKAGLVERVCQHGVGHDDPDSVAYLRSQGHTWAGTHGCDGCCR